MENSQTKETQKNFNAIQKNIANNLEKKEQRKTMKVKIQQRSVYHKFAEVEVEVPNNLTDDKILDYLWDNEDLYVDKIDEAMSKASYEYGFGTDSDANAEYNSCMDEDDSESEWRFECEELKIGGHL